jgi:hypothetical protein
MISASAFATNLATLSITTTKPGGTTGALNIKSLATMPRQIENRDCDVLIPASEFQTGLTMERGSAGVNAFREVDWTANYVYCFCEIGRNRWSNEFDDTIADNVKAICDAIAAGLATLGVVDVQPGPASNSGIVTMANDKKFYGAQIDIAVHDWYNST